MKMVMGWQENSMRWVRPPPRLWVHVSDAVVTEVRSMPHWFVSDTRFQHHGQLSLSLSCFSISLSHSPHKERRKDSAEEDGRRLWCFLLQVVVFP